MACLPSCFPRLFPVGLALLLHLVATSAPAQSGDLRVSGLSVGQGDRYAVLVGETIRLQATVEARASTADPYCTVPGLEVTFLVDGASVGTGVTVPAACGSPNVALDVPVPPAWNGRASLQVGVTAAGTPEYQGGEASAPVRISVVGRSDPGGLWGGILSGNRIEGVDLNNLLANGLRSRSGELLGPTHQRLVVTIHGWNSAPNGGQWGGVNNALASRLPATWTHVAYDWRNDAADTALRETEVFGPRRVSTRAYQHGIAMAESILRQVGTENLVAVHLVAHSAGSWAVYSAASYLAAHGPGNIALQVTYLDPFVPDILATHPFKRSFLESSNLVAREWPMQSSLRADLYWAQDGLAGTDHPTWAWPAVAPGSPATRSATVRTDVRPNAAENGWTGHDGPVKFYGDTILDTSLTIFGWSRSLAVTEPSGSNNWLLH